MQTPIRCLAAAAMLCASPALADETDPPEDFTVRGSAAVVSDYRFRGLSRSSGDPAFQASLEVDHVSGIYAGLWTSTLDLDSAGRAADRRLGGAQVDVYAGWSGAIGGSGWIADLGLVYYAFPDSDIGKAGFFEPQAAISTSLGPARAKLGVRYAWKQQALNFDGGGKDDNLYVYADLGAGIPGTPLSLSAHLGYTDGALSPKFATGQTRDYAGGFDWSLGASYAIAPNLSIGGHYVGVEGRRIKGLSNDTVVGTLKLSF